MNCDEAHSLFGIVLDLEEDDPRRIELEQHTATCSDCQAELALWKESRLLMMELQEEPTEEQAEEINRNVMDRIYRESPWLIPDQSKPFAVPASTRKRMSWWIAGFVMVFLVSFLYWAIMDKPFVKETAEAVPTGILPTGIAGSSVVTEQVSYVIPKTNSGIIEPLVAGMGPTHPQYWMILSVLGVGMALFSLGRVSRIRK
ncbi:anti-sigma factor [Paenibacillus sp. Y412MC10]|uniref:anti-sigma factor n=1 Tax=Geobacillus sp. (strain Y412MC10) TaxID=481743 RepID=UPI0011AB7BEB|nr:anti-sigma factor [Paenibacillus sp. Y412MC10]